MSQRITTILSDQQTKSLKVKWIQQLWWSLVSYLVKPVCGQKDRNSRQKSLLEYFFNSFNAYSIYILGAHVPTPIPTNTLNLIILQTTKNDKMTKYLKF